MRRHDLLALVFFSIFIFGGCALFHKDPPPEPWSGRIYVGDSERQGLYRGQDEELITTKDQRYNDMICMSSGDFKALLSEYRYFRATCDLAAP